MIKVDSFKAALEQVNKLSKGMNVFIDRAINPSHGVYVKDVGCNQLAYKKYVRGCLVHRGVISYNLVTIN